MKPTMYVEKRSDLTLLKKAFELTDATCHRTRLKCGCIAYNKWQLSIKYRIFNK